MQDAFEHWLYGEAPEDVIPADLDAKWLELKERFEPWDDDYASEAEKMTGWQRNTWSLFRMPLYMITYPIAMVGTCQLGRLVQTDRARVINNYKAALASIPFK
jgi:oligoendopeptidase F